jgi:hypothetical protein
MFPVARQCADSENNRKLNRKLTLRIPMTRDDDLRIRLGRVRDRGRIHRAKPFIAQALAAAERAGGFKRRSARNARSSTFGRGRSATVAAARFVSERSRSVTVKARVVRHRQQRTKLGRHLDYLRRDGVTKDGAAGRMFDGEHDEADHRAFAARCEDDRHHFRFIVSPEDADRLSNLKALIASLSSATISTRNDPSQ